MSNRVPAVPNSSRAVDAVSRILFNMGKADPSTLAWPTVQNIGLRGIHLYNNKSNCVLEVPLTKKSFSTLKIPKRKKNHEIERDKVNFFQLIKHNESFVDLTTPIKSSRPTCAPDKKKTVQTKISKPAISRKSNSHIHSVSSAYLKHSDSKMPKKRVRQLSEHYHNPFKRKYYHYNPKPLDSPKVRKQKDTLISKSRVSNKDMHKSPFHRKRTLKSSDSALFSEAVDKMFSEVSIARKTEPRKVDFRKNEIVRNSAIIEMAEQGRTHFQMTDIIEIPPIKDVGSHRELNKRGEHKRNSQKLQKKRKTLMDIDINQIEKEVGTEPMMNKKERKVKVPRKEKVKRHEFREEHKTTEPPEKTLTSSSSIGFRSQHKLSTKSITGSIDTNTESIDDSIIISPFLESFLSKNQSKQEDSSNTSQSHKPMRIVHHSIKNSLLFGSDLGSELKIERPISFDELAKLTPAELRQTIKQRNRVIQNFVNKLSSIESFRVKRHEQLDSYEVRLNKLKRFLYSSELSVKDMDNISIDDIDMNQLLHYPYESIFHKSDEMPTKEQKISTRTKPRKKPQPKPKIEIPRRTCECCICSTLQRNRPTMDDKLIMKMKQELKRLELKAYIKNRQVFQNWRERDLCDSVLKYTNTSSILVPCQKPSVLCHQNALIKSAKFHRNNAKLHSKSMFL